MLSSLKLKNLSRSNSTARSGLTLLILAQTLVALNIVLSKYLLLHTPLLVLIITRFLLAGLILLPLHYASSARKQSIQQHLRQLTIKDYYYLTAQAVCGGVLFNLFMSLGLQYTDANLAGIIASTLPAIIAIMAVIILKEKISRKKLLCVGYATLGLALISYDKASGPIGNSSLTGNFLVFVALIPEAFYYILCKLHPNKLPPFLASSLINLLNGALCLVALLYTPIPQQAISAQCWMLLAVSALNSGLFYAFWFLGSKSVDGVMSSLTTAVMPISTVAFAWLLLHEDLTRMECLGMGLVLFSIFIYAKS